MFAIAQRGRFVLILLVAVALGVFWYRSYEPTEPAAVSFTEERRQAFKKETEGLTPETFVNEAEPTGELVGAAPFLGVEQEVSGSALVYKNDTTTVLRITQLAIQSAPNVHVVLATDLQEAKMIDLGPLRAVFGELNYPLPAGTDLKEYPYVLLRSQSYDVIIGYAEFTKGTIR